MGMPSVKPSELYIQCAADIFVGVELFPTPAFVCFKRNKWEPAAAEDTSVASEMMA